MDERHIKLFEQEFRIIMSKLLPENQVMFCRPEDADKIIESIRKMEKELGEKS